MTDRPREFLCHGRLDWYRSFRRPCTSLTSVFTRQREVDSFGRATIRYWGVALVCGVCTLFWLVVVTVNLHDPFHQRHPENLVVEGFFLLLSSSAAFWFYYFRATLTSSAVLIKWFPTIERSYSLSEVSEIRRVSAVSVVIKLKDGKKLQIFNGSGVTYFLEAMEQAVAKAIP